MALTPREPQSSSDPLVCVVTPVRNGEKFIASAIESVQRQTLVQWEYFIVDGASSDRTLEIASAASEVDNRIRVISEPDAGMYDALFKGFWMGRAPICCWLNADDMFLPWAFELAYEYMTARGAEWVTGLPALWDDRGRMVSVGSVPWYPRRLVATGWFHGRGLGWIQQESTFFSRKLLEKFTAEAREKVRTTKLAGDFLMWTEFAKHAPLHVIPTVLSGFRSHTSNMSSRNREKYFQEIQAAGFWIPPEQVGMLLRLGFLPLQLVAGWLRRRQWQAGLLGR